MTVLQLDFHPDMAELLAAKEAVPQDDSTDVSRAGWNNYAASMQRPYPPGMVVGDMPLACPDAGRNGRILVRFYRPAGLPSPTPCVVYLHGGAFIKGSLDSGDPIAWGIADQVRAIVVGVEYRLAPDDPFPAGVEDCYAVLKHLADYAPALGIDATRLAVWGDSAGGNMAASACLMARDRGAPAIVAQVLVYPCLTDELTADSYLRYAKAPVSTDSIDRGWNMYLGARRPTRNGYAAPLKAEDLSNLPPAFIHYAEFDCLADDSRQYAARLRQAGNDVTLRCAERMIHGFVRARFSGPVAAQEYDMPCAFLRRRLQ